MSEQPRVGQYWHYKKSGDVVTILHLGKMQHSFPTIGHPILDNEEVVVYEHYNNVWVRMLSEFMDGRFELVSR